MSYAAQQSDSGFPGAQLTFSATSVSNYPSDASAHGRSAQQVLHKRIAISNSADPVQEVCCKLQYRFTKQHSELKWSGCT
jgi:hypothetical protein